MVSREQANQIGNALIEQEEALQRAKKNATARRHIPLSYRFPELQSVELSKRPALLRAARTASLKEPAFIALCLFYLVLTITSILYTVKFHPLGELPTVVYCLAMAILMSPLFIYQRILMRRHVRAAALARHGKADSRASVHG